MKKLFDKEVLFEHKPHFNLEDTPAEFENRPHINLYVPEVQYNLIFEAYGLKPTNFKEKVVNIKNINGLLKENNSLTSNWVTSVDVLAMRKEKVGREEINPLAAMGIVTTKDNYVLFGLRGGEITPERVEIYGSGLFGAPPGGSVTFKDSYKEDPVIDTLMEEFKEEVGSFDVKFKDHIGMFEAYSPGPKGLKMVSVLQTDATVSDIIKTHTKAIQKYNKLLKLGATKKEAQAELEADNLPKDAWEHEYFISIEDNKKALKFFQDSAPLAGIGAGALNVYLNKYYQEG